MAPRPGVRVFEAKEKTKMNAESNKTRSLLAALALATSFAAPALAADDPVTDGYWQTQETYDRIFQNESDEILGIQRLTDQYGTEYQGEYGSDSYWLTPDSNEPVGVQGYEAPSWDATPLEKSDE
jgi:hypothetical protein